jgi:hypothetical protein
MVAVARNIAAIEVWRGTLPPERLAELNHPRVVLDHWRRSLGTGALKYKRANSITAIWQRSSREQRTAGLGGIPFDDFRICMPPEWHAGMVAAARRPCARLFARPT